MINPKSVTLSELYGAYDLSTFEWADGILSTLFKQSAESDKPDEKVRKRKPCSDVFGLPSRSLARNSDPKYKNLSDIMYEDEAVLMFTLGVVQLKPTNTK